MADLDESESSMTVKLIGSASTGVESNFAEVTPANELKASLTHNSTYVSASITVNTTEDLAAVGGSNLVNRKELLIFNDGSKDIYFGPSGVSSSGANKGIKIGIGAFQSIPVGDNVLVYLVTATGSSTVIIQEFA
jgi:hypothetical protein